MATPPNNYFAQNVVTIPDQNPPAPGAPKVITLDYYAEGISDYTISCPQLTSYYTYINVVGPTTGGAVNLYIPSTYSLNGQIIIVKNNSADNLIITPVSGVQIDEGLHASLTLVAPASPGDLGAVTLMADPTNADSWYILSTYVQL